MIDLESIGLSQDELQERVVNTMADRLLKSYGIDEDYDARSSAFETKMKREMESRIVAHLDAYFAEKVGPLLIEYVETLTLQETNKWGEKKGTPVTFIEYLTKRAEQYLTEKVNYVGNENSPDRWMWKADQTRATNLINTHLHYSIQTAMQDAVKNANTIIADGLKKTVEIKLAEIAKALTVNVGVGR